MTAPSTEAADPRPPIVERDGAHRLQGGRCRRCAHALLRRFGACPRCGSEVEAAEFGPGGAVWSFTVVHVAPGAGHEVPYTLAYVDLDDGPRVLLRLVGGAPAVGAPVRLRAPVLAGQPTGEVVA